MNRTCSLLLTCLLVLAALKLGAQSSAVTIFTQDPEPFSIIMNGIQQNPDPETNVRITGLDAPNYKIRILYKDKNLPEVNKTVYLEPDMETTFELLKNSKGERVLRMRNSVPVRQDVDPVEGQEVYIFTTTPRTSTSTTTVSQTTTVSTPGMGGVSVTTTTTQSSTNVTTGAGSGYEEQGGHGDHGGHGEYEEYSDPRYPDYHGPRGCPRPMSDRSFEEARASVASKTFADSKLTIARQVTSSNCLLARQVREIMKLFNFESDRLEYAKFAYKYTWDLKNFFLVNDAFQFESSIEELNTYINSRR